MIDRHEPITIIGGDARAIADLKRRYGLTDVRWHDPPMGLKQKPDAIVKRSRVCRRAALALYLHLRGRAATGDDRLRHRPAR